MNHYTRFFALLPLVFILALPCGCPSKGPTVNRVEGIVTLDGTPVEGANVSFAPKAGSGEDLSGPLLAGGKTDAAGKYTLTTNRGSTVGAGTTAGEYNVSIVKKTMTNPLTAPLAPGQRFVPQYEYGVPKAFEEAAKSGISVEVVKGKNVINFALKSDGTFEITK